MGPSPSLDDQMTEYINAHRHIWKATTTKRRLAAMRAFGRWANETVLDGYVAPKPAPPEPHPIPGGIPAVERVLWSCHWLPGRSLIGLCGLMGLRVGEALTITQDDVFMLDGTLNLHIVGKGSRERRIPMSAKATGFILPGIACGPVPTSHTAARQLFIVESKKAGIGHHPSHDFRATAATAFYYASGKDLRATQLFLGHANSSTTEVYVQPARKRLLAGVNF